MPKFDLVQGSTISSPASINPVDGARIPIRSRLSALRVGRNCLVDDPQFQMITSEAQSFSVKILRRFGSKAEAPCGSA